MSIIHVMATIRCDGCNDPFVLRLDRAAKPEGTIDDYVEELVRGPNYEHGIHTSIQGSHLLCVKCTKFIDDKFDDDQAQLTYDQVCEALNERAGV